MLPNDRCMMQARALLRIGVVAALMALMAGTTACNPGERPVIGVALSASFVYATRLAIEDAAREGPVLDVDTLISAEGTSEAGPAIQVARSMVAAPGIVAVIGHSNSATSLAAAQVYNDAKVMQLAPTSTAVLYGQSGPYSYRMVPPDNMQGNFIADVVHRRFPGGARVALLYVNDDYGRGLRASLRAALDVERFPLVLDIPHVDSDTRIEVITQSANAARQARPDIVIWLSRGFVLHQYLPELRSAVGNTPIVASDAVSSWTHAVSGDSRWSGVQYVDFVDLEASDELRAFRKRFAERFGIRASGGEVLTYDAVRVILAGIAQGARSGEAMRAYLHSLGRDAPPYQGLAGPLSFTDDGDVNRRHLLVTVLETGATP